MKARFLWATVIVLILLSLPALVLAQPPVVSSTEPSGDGVEGVPMASPGALWDQPSAGLWIIFDQYLPDIGMGVYDADDFSNADPWNIERIFVDGHRWSAATGSLPQADSLNWLIYPDAGGVPAGYPDIGGELWSHSCLPSDPEVTISGPDSGEATLDIVKAQGAPLYLPPGQYWLCFYPSLSYTLYGQSWGWSLASTTNLATAHIIDPYDLFGDGWTSWTPWTALNSTFHDAAFRLEGTVVKPPPNVKYLHSTDGLFNLTKPIGTQWHELYPLFCREYQLSSWEDNGDGFLSPSDQIDMYQKPDGEVRWYHVDEVTITLFVTPAENGLVDSGFGRLPLGQPMYIELEGGYNASVLTAPNYTQWHEIYPVFCTRYELTSWEDTGNRTGELGFCDYIWLLNKWSGVETYWHVEEVAVDITVTIKPPPVGGEAYPVNKISVLTPWIVLAVLLAGGTSWFILRRRRAQS